MLYSGRMLTLHCVNALAYLVLYLFLTPNFTLFCLFCFFHPCIKKDGLNDLIQFSYIKHDKLAMNYQKFETKQFKNIILRVCPYFPNKIRFMVHIKDICKRLCLHVLTCIEQCYLKTCIHL